MAKAKPKPKTPPPPPAPKKKPSAPPAVADPALDHFAQGLSALQAKEWKKAIGHLELAVETTDRSDLRDRARQFLNAARQKSGPAEGKAAKGHEPEPYLQAVYERNRGNLKAALDIAQKGGRDHKDERFAYLVASIHAVENRLEDAAQALARAVELNPKNRIHAFHDVDFAELRKNRDQRHLFGLT
jgi:tetratricopeptide (TPR) repeat protein